MPSATIDGLRISYHHAVPDSEASQRVLLVHGTGCNGGLWHRVLRRLADAGHEAVAIDLPGHGDSEGDGFRGVVDYAHFVARLAESIGWDRYILGGHSLGGGIALAVALYDGAPLAGLVLVDTGARLRVNPSLIASARRLAETGEAGSGNPRFGYAEATSDELVAEIATRRAGERADVLYKDWLADDSCDFMSRLRSIDVPAVAICGAEDPLTPVKYHEYFRDHLPDCGLVVIPGAGHWPYFEQPESFDAALLAYLDDRGSAGA